MLRAGIASTPPATALLIIVAMPSEIGPLERRLRALLVSGLCQASSMQITRVRQLTDGFSPAPVGSRTVLTIDTFRGKSPAALRPFALRSAHGSKLFGFGRLQSIVAFCRTDCSPPI